MKMLLQHRDMEHIVHPFQGGRLAFPLMALSEWSYAGWTKLSFDIKSYHTIVANTLKSTSLSLNSTFDLLE
jgi:hypothetical protein